MSHISARASATARGCRDCGCCSSQPALSPLLMLRTVLLLCRAIPSMARAALTSAWLLPPYGGPQVKQPASAAALARHQLCPQAAWGHRGWTRSAAAPHWRAHDCSERTLVQGPHAWRAAARTRHGDQLELQVQHAAAGGVGARCAQRRCRLRAQVCRCCLLRVCRNAQQWCIASAERLPLPGMDSQASNSPVAACSAAAAAPAAGLPCVVGAQACRLPRSPTASSSCTPHAGHLTACSPVRAFMPCAAGRARRQGSECNSCEKSVTGQQQRVACQAPSPGSATV